MARIKKPSVKIVLRKDKILSNGDHPVCLRLTFNRKSKYFVLKGDTGTLSSKPAKWNTDIGRFNRNRNYNHQIEHYELEARKILKELENKEFSFQTFEKKYFKQYNSTKIILHIDGIIQQLKSETRYGTAQVYKDTRNRLKEFDEKIKFEDLDVKFIESFERALIKKGNSTNSISIYLRTLRATYNKALKGGIFNQDNSPFKQFKIKNGNPVKRALNKNDMLKLLNF